MGSLKHLTVGSECPPLKPDKLRIYAMRFCPYAQRALLVSAAKNIQTDVVYVNLKDKPEWIFEKNPGGKVPTLELNDGRILYESLIVADYLDEAYPGVKLTSQDPFQKAEDRILIENFGQLGMVFYKLIFLPDTPKSEVPDLVLQYNKVIEMMSKELNKRGTTFFGGNDHPGMIDYMIWPWFERRPVVELTHPDAADYSQLKEKTTDVDAWVEKMIKDPGVQAYYLSPDIHHEYNSLYRSGTPNFNLLAED